jgi:hypothetical protein
VGRNTLKPENKDGSMSDDQPFYAPDRKPTAKRQPVPGELLFEFHVPATHTFWRVELRDNGAYGVEVQFLDPVEIRFAQTFRQDMDPARAPRAMAIQWADEARKIVEKGGAR